jgi:hypothetical protein
MPQRVILIHSPHSGRSSQLPGAIKHLEQAGPEVVSSISIADLDDLPAQGTLWKESGVAAALAAGGDGLVGGVVAHIAESGLPLGILPLGTSNDIARALHIPQDIGEAAHVIAQGREQEVDIGMAQSAEQTTRSGTPPIWLATGTSYSPKWCLLRTCVDSGSQRAICTHSDQRGNAQALRAYDLPLCCGEDNGGSRCIGYSTRV